MKGSGHLNKGKIKDSIQTKKFTVSSKSGSCVQFCISTSTKIKPANKIYQKSFERERKDSSGAMVLFVGERESEYNS